MLELFNLFPGAALADFGVSAAIAIGSALANQYASKKARDKQHVGGVPDTATDWGEHARQGLMQSLQNRNQQPHPRGY